MLTKHQQHVRPSRSPMQHVASRARRPVAVVKAQLLQNLAGMFSRLKPSSAAPAPASRQLLRLLAEPDVDRNEIDACVDALAASGLPFNEQNLGGGLWRVVHTRGQLLLWDRLQRPTSALGRFRNAAGQDLDPATRTVVNKAEFWGPDVYVTASGTYTPDPEADGEGQGRGLVRRMPVAVGAHIRGGELHVGGTVIPLPFIKGKGRFEVLYLDQDVRVFRSQGGIAVQVRDDVLQQMGM